LAATAGRQHRGRLKAQFIKQRLSLFQIGAIEAFGAPFVASSKQRSRLGAPDLPGEQAPDAVVPDFVGSDYLVTNNLTMLVRSVGTGARRDRRWAKTSAYNEWADNFNVHHHRSI
jgi:hypothetical protein